MKHLSKSLWTWVIVLAAVASAIVLAVGDAGLPEAGFATFDPLATSPVSAQRESPRPKHR